MAYEVKKDESGKLAVFKDGKYIGAVAENGDHGRRSNSPLYSVLFGTATEEELNVAKKILGNDSAVVMKLLTDGGKEKEIENFLENYLGKSETLVKTGDGVFSIVKTVRDSEEKNSPEIFAEILSQAFLEEFGESVKIGLGSIVKDAEGLAESNAQSDTALRLAEKKHAEGNVFSYKNFVLTKVAAEMTKEEAKATLYSIMCGKSLDIFQNAELLKTAKTFLKCNLSLSETARKLFLHRNTLSYRLRIIERVTGLSIKDFKGASVFNFAAELFDRLNEKED